MELRLAFGFLLLFGSLALGKWLSVRGVLTEAAGARLVRWLVRGSSPVVLCLSAWRMNFRDATPWLLPFIGLSVALSALLPAAWFARANRMTPAQTGSFLNAALFSNIGYFGGLLIFALFGEAGYGYAQLFLLFFTPCFYTVGFWLAAHFGRSDGQLPQTKRDGALYGYPFAGLLLGIVLSFMGVPRWPVLEWVNHTLIPVDTGLYLMVIGSQLELAPPRGYWRACLAMCGIKFFYSPAIAWLLISWLGLEGLPRQVVLLQAATPVAVSPLILPMLFGLDKRLMNAAWLFTTVVAVAWFVLLVPWVMHF